ncbi:MAG: glycoside hydrolase family 28 protein [Epulopiscium sp.]|nr:glycoside hydrolase family 28 protein [Candidatus Epulonipiscium sp.]
MNFDIIFKTSRKICIEIKNYGIFYTNKPYTVLLNGEQYMVSNKVVQTIKGLKPDTEYTLQIVNEEGSSEVVRFKTDYEFVTLNVRKFGAKGDGINDDTICIQAAINACPKDGRVYIPKGVYRISSLFLKSDITIDIDDEAVLSAFTEREKFPILPGLIESYDETSEYNLGTWEGNPLDMFASIITGINVSNVVITGGGTLDGNASFENWWYKDGREKTGGAFRPRMIFLNHCENITVHGIKVQNSPAWNLHPYFSNNTRWIDLTVLNPKDSPNTDGMDPESVNGLEVVGVYFSLGDDCIAVKSGKFYMGHKYKVPSQNIEIRQCYMCYGHGSVTLGSEMAAGVKNLVCKQCIFENTDRGLRIKTRRGRGNDAVIENILFEDIKMDGVLTPFVVNSFYWCCDPDGRSEYVRCKDPLPVDERTPFIKQLAFKNIEAHNAHVAASFIYGLPEAKIEEVSFENVSIDFAENPTPDYPAMMADVEPCTKKGIYINNVKKLILKNVKVIGAEGKEREILNVDELIEE